MESMNLHNIYRSANENTVAMWRENAGIGDIRQGNYYDPVKLALAAGIQLRDRQVFLVPDSVKQYEKRGNGIKRSTTLCHPQKEVALPDDTLSTDAAIPQLKQSY